MHLLFSLDRDAALLGPAGCRGEILDATVAMLVPDFQLFVLRRPESNGDDRLGRCCLHQRQTEGTERLVELELR